MRFIAARLFALDHIDCISLFGIHMPQVPETTEDEPGEATLQPRIVLESGAAEGSDRVMTPNPMSKARSARCIQRIRSDPSSRRVLDKDRSPSTTQAENLD